MVEEIRTGRRDASGTPAEKDKSMGLFDISVNTLSDKEKKIADFALKNVDRLAYLSINELADELNVSIATISRFWKSIGYQSFKHAKEQLKENLKVTPASKMTVMIDRMNDGDVPDTVISQQIRYLQDTAAHLDRGQLQQATDCLLNARTIYIFGPGPSACLSDLLYFRLNRFGKTVVQLPKSGREIYEHLVHAGSGDAVIVFGFLRPLPEIRVILENGRLEGYTTILFTDLRVSEMIDASDIVLYTCRGEVSEFHSMAVPMTVIDCVIASIAAAGKADTIQRLEKLGSLRKRYYHYIPR